MYIKLANFVFSIGICTWCAHIAMKLYTNVCSSNPLIKDESGESVQ